MYRIPYVHRNEAIGAGALAQILPFIDKKGENRLVFRYINVSGQWIQATDGKRGIRFLQRHLAIGEKVPDGIYSVTKEGKDLILVHGNDSLTFPNLNGVYPKKWDYQFNAATDVPPKSKEESLADLAFRLAKADVRMNPRFLRELPADRWIVGVNSPTSPVIFRGDFFEVVLMPLMPPRDKNDEPFTSGFFERVPYEDEIQEQTEQSIRG
jgi:hypothetical protein